MVEPFRGAPWDDGETAARSRARACSTSPILAGAVEDGPPACGETDVAAFVRLVLNGDQPAIRAIARRVMAAPAGREVLLRRLLAPAARHLGALWEQDRADFMDVTIGTHRLSQLMKETEFADGQPALTHRHRHRALLLPAPGEQHGFGIAMVAEVFRSGGWRVRTGAAIPGDRLPRLARGAWFDMVGFSVSAERHLGGIAALIRAIRHASRNARLLVLLGGPAIAGHAERSRFLGADMAAADAYQALEDANMMMESLGNRVGQHATASMRLDMR